MIAKPCLIAFLIFILLNLNTRVSAIIPAFERTSASVLRGKLNNKLLFDINTLPAGEPVPGAVFRLADVTQFPSLGLPDVQMAFARVRLEPGVAFPRHVHPRASEMLLNLAGTLRVEIRQEGNLPDITFQVKKGLFAAVPEGLPHKVRCISKFRCKLVVFFNSGDPGTAFV